IAVITAACGWVSVDRFSINSEMNDLIEQDTAWRRDFDAFADQFPSLIQTAFVVVSGPSVKGVENTSKRLGENLLSTMDVFQEVYAPATDGFFRDHLLLYLDYETLSELADKLAEAQPMLTAVAEDQSLIGVLKLLRSSAENDPVEGLEPILRLLAESAEAVHRGERGEVSWTDELFERDGTQYQLIILKGYTDHGLEQPNAVTIENIRKIIAQTEIDPGVNVRITGEIALEFEEIAAAKEGVKIAGIVSLVLLTLLLSFGVRSFRVVVVSLLQLFVGIVWTSAYALLTVGEYNTLSLIFLVMFFGLGIDFALHFCLRYQEALLPSKTSANLLPDNQSLENGSERDVKNQQALQAATSSVGRAIVLCTVTTALGFLSFVPTEYKGLADLGVISAGGMVIAAFLTFTLIPAFFAFFGPPKRNFDPNFSLGWISSLVKHPRKVMSVLVFAAIGASYVASQTYFDFSVLALRDPDSESMSTLRELQREGVVTDYSLSLLTQSRGNDSSLVSQLEALPTVEGIRTPESFLPKDQSDNLELLDDIQTLLWSAIEPVRQAQPPSEEQLSQAVRRTAQVIGDAGYEAPDLQAANERLRVSMIALLNDGPEALSRWQSASLSNLLEELAWLRRALAVEQIEFSQLPKSLRSRLVGTDGSFHTVLLPAEDISNVASLRAFLEEVRGIVPEATGRPVIEWGVGKIVVDAFTQAMIFALCAIALVLLVTLRSVLNAALVFAPLFLTAVFVMAIAVALNMPLNMANILVVPLIFGLGVDNGIHVVERFLHDKNFESLMSSSTPRAILLSSLTTLGTFASLSLSPHQGTASIGLLLSIAVALLLVFAVFLLPVLLGIAHPDKGADSGPNSSKLARSE
ncbi:MMPL family transporter, partial [Pseudomonadales bacterium]|nr:MMPL family transporter [Pseudomonadales bacterium]